MKSSILHLLVVVVALSVLHHLRRSVTQRAEELILGAPVGDTTPASRLVGFVVLINFKFPFLHNYKKSSINTQ